MGEKKEKIKEKRRLKRIYASYINLISNVDNETERVFASLIKMHRTKLRQGNEVSIIVVREIGRKCS